MRDSLDLEALTQQANGYKQTSRKYRNRTLIMLVIWLVALTVLSNMLSTTPGTLYVSDGDTWQSVDLPGAPVDIQISESGILWISTTLNGGLSRYDGETWTHYDADDFGTTHDELVFFTLDGDELWGAAQSDVFHFADNTWTAYPNVIPSGSAAGIVAGDFGIMVIDFDSNISQYDRETWTTHSAYDVLPGFNGGGSTWPNLLKTSNGNVWLTDAQVWRFDGHIWSRINPSNDYQYYDLIGANDKSVWLNTWYSIVLFDFETEQWRRLNLGDMGLDRATAQRFPDIAFDAESIWIATDTEILHFNNDTWTPIAMPSIADNQRIGSLAKDGHALWLATYNTDVFRADFRTQHCWGYIVTLVGVIGFIVLLLLFWKFPLSRISLQRARQSRDHLHQILPGLKEYVPLYNDADKLNRRQRNAILLIFVIFIVLALTGGLPRGILFLLLGIMLVLWGVAPFLLSFRNPSLDAENRQYLRRNLWLSAILLAGIVGVELFLFEIILPSLENSLNNLLLVVAVFILGIWLGTLLLFYIVLLAPVIVIVKKPLAQGDYDTALRWVGKLRRWLPKYPNFMIVHGLILLFIGHNQEAEQTWREFLTETQNGAPLLKATGLANLGYALSGQQRYEEALPLFVGAIEMVPESGSLAQALANHYRQQDAYPECALELTEYALQFNRKPRLNYFLQRYNWGELLATRALALANVGRFDEAEVTIQQALAETDRRFRPGMAALHIRAARIKRLQNDRASARQHLQTALELDPNGANGQAAQKALNESEQDE